MHPRLAYPFTILAQPDVVRLVAGEDCRYTFSGPGLERWLPALLARFTGAATLESLLADLPDDLRPQAQALVERLYGERLLVEGTAAAAHPTRAKRVNDAVRVLRQDRLDYLAALTAQREARRVGAPFLWSSTGAMSRGYVGPLFLPDAGPCFACLLATFRRLSPSPELYDALIDHGEHGRPFSTVPFPEEGVSVLQALVAWKLSQFDLPEPSAALYRLHVLELDTMEVSSHRVFVDAECPECQGNRR